MSLLKKPKCPKQRLKNRLKEEERNRELSDGKGISFGISDDELFIGSVFSGDLLVYTKNDQKSKEAFYKRFSLIPNEYSRNW